MLRWGVAGILSCVLGVAALAEDAFPTEGSNTVVVIAPPSPRFPVVASTFGITGHCEVHFDILEYGDHVRITTLMCTNLLFCAEAKNAVHAARFRVEDVPETQTPGERYNLVYPFEFLFESDDTSVSELPLHNCRGDIPIS